MFCEECGSKLEPGIRFCENCGTPVPAEEDIKVDESVQDEEKALWDNLFKLNEWSKKWGNLCANKSGEQGIILTKSKILCQQLGCSKTDLVSVVLDYIQFSKSREINYFFLDLDENKVSLNPDNSVENVVTTLSKIADINIPKYLFILGNEDVIDFQKWQNGSEDSDSEVPSDLPYAVLNSTTPWDGMKYDFDSAIRVGRLPTWTGESFANFKNYFDNAKLSIGKIKNIKSYGLSALVWKEETECEYSTFASGTIDVSPEVNQFNVDSRIPADTNHFLFNLHGSNSTKYWYGQNGSEYPEAFSPDNMRNIKSPNFIGVEACYGAIYENNRNSADSNVIAAMTNNTIALLGSSRIAYGTSCPPGSCADVVVGEFVKQIANGATAGDAHIEGLKKLCNVPEMDDSDIKTLCEFALYGDPSASTGALKSVTKHSAVFTGLIKSAGMKTASNKIRVAMPDVRAAVRLSLANVNSKISDAIDAHVYSTYKEMVGVRAKTFALSNSRLFQSVYENQDKQIVKVYFDTFGKIKKEIHSK